MNDGASSPASVDSTLSAAQVSGLLDVVTAAGHTVGLEPVLRRIVEVATDLVGARYGALGILDDRNGLADFLFVGLDQDQADAIGAWPERRGLLGQLMWDPCPLRLPDLSAHVNFSGFPMNHPAMTSFLGVPVRVRGDVFGNLYCTEKIDGSTFTLADEQLAVALAALAGVAVENERLHARVSELALVEERERIARDLHDTVLQRIFSIGLAFEGAATQATDADLSSKLTRAAADLDATVDQIRTTVFNLDAPGGNRRPVRRELSDFIAELGSRLGVATSLRFDGDIDPVLGVESLSQVTHQLFAAARDAVVGLNEHYRAETADLSVTVGQELTLHIGCDTHPAGETRTDWLPALQERAQTLGGRMVFTADHGGAELIWTVPLDLR